MILNEMNCLSLQARAGKQKVNSKQTVDKEEADSR
jgi:hypothetical protein